MFFGMRSTPKLCDCAVCGDPVWQRRYQDDTARTCSPKCARDLAYAEDPGLGGFLNRATQRAEDEAS